MHTELNVWCVSTCFIEAIFMSNLQGYNIWRTLRSSGGHVEGANTRVSSVSPLLLKTCVCVLAWVDVVSMEAPGSFCSVDSCLSASHEGVYGSRSITPLILNLDNGWRWIIIFTPQLLYPRYPFNRTLDRRQSRCGYISFSVPSESSAAATTSCFLSCDFPCVAKETVTSFSISLPCSWMLPSVLFQYQWQSPLFKRHFSGIFLPFNVPSVIQSSTFYAALYAWLPITMCFPILDSATAQHSTSVLVFS